MCLAWLTTSVLVRIANLFYNMEKDSSPGTSGSESPLKLDEQTIATIIEGVTKKLQHPPKDIPSPPVLSELGELTFSPDTCSIQLSLECELPGTGEREGGGGGGGGGG